MTAMPFDSVFPDPTYYYSITQQQVNQVNSLRRQAAADVEKACTEPESTFIYAGLAIGTLQAALELLLGPLPTIQFTTTVLPGPCFPSPETPSPGGPEPDVISPPNTTDGWTFGNTLTK